MMVTVERKQMKELGKTTRTVDILLGRIPKQALHGDVSTSAFDKISVLASGVLLIICSALDYIVLKNDLNNALPMLVIGVIIIILGLFCIREE
jgi:hypothetical protein